MEFIPHDFEFKGQRIVWYSAEAERQQGDSSLDQPGDTRKQAKPPLIILHGWGSEAKVFFPLCKSLSDIRTCYLIDFPGFGRSEQLRTAWKPEMYVSLVEDWLNEVVTWREPGSIDASGSASDSASSNASGGESWQSVDVLVHSFGNRVLLRLIAEGRIADRIGKIIVTGGAGLKPKRNAKTRFKQGVAKTATFPARLLPGGLRQKYHRWVRTTALWKSISSADYARLEGPMRETFVNVVNDHLDSLLPSIQREMLLLWGENDTATPVEQGRRLEKAIRGSALVVIKGAGHYAFLDKPGEFHAIVRSYLTS